MLSFSLLGALPLKTFSTEYAPTTYTTMTTASEPVASEPVISPVATTTEPTPIETGQESAFTTTEPTSSYQVPMKISAESYMPPPETIIAPTEPLPTAEPEPLPMPEPVRVSTALPTVEPTPEPTPETPVPSEPYVPPPLPTEPLPPSAGVRFEVVQPPPEAAAAALPATPAVLPVGLSKRGKWALGIAALLIAGYAISRRRR